MSLANLRIARKLALGFAVILAIFATVGGAIFVSAARVETTQAANVAAQAMLVDVEKLAAARYDQAQTARGFIIIRTERHSKLYGEATKLFGETLAKTRDDALASIRAADGDNVNEMLLHRWIGRIIHGLWIDVV